MTLGSADPVRFGIWANVYGSWAVRDHPEDPADASWAWNARTVREAEALGYESTLVAQHVFNPVDDELDQLETWTSIAALAATTSRIEIIGAIKPLLVHPVLFAKQLLNLAEISEGRVAINVVNAWFRPELERAGIPFPEHDERYAYGAEWTEIVTALLRGERVSFSGRFFTVRDYQLRPIPPAGLRPHVYSGGESEAGQAFATAHAETWFVNGQPLEDVRALVDAVRARPGGADKRFALAAFAIIAPTAGEAREKHEELWALQTAERERAAGDALGQGLDPAVKMFQTFARHDRVIGTNGGTSAGLVGSYDEVAEGIVRFKDAGIRTFMLQFQPFRQVMAEFAEEVVPRVRRREARRGEVVGAAR